MWEYDENWMVYKLKLDDFVLTLSDTPGGNGDDYSLMVTSQDTCKIYLEYKITSLELAKERALVLYSKVSGRSMNGIQKELYERQVTE